MFEGIKRFLEGVMRSMFGKKEIKSAFGVDSALSDKMAIAIQKWGNLMQNKAPWINEEVKGRNLAIGVVNEIVRLVLTEFKLEIIGESKRAKELTAIFETAFLPFLDRNLEYAVGKGSMIFKPFMQNGKISTGFVQAGSFIPVSYTATGDINACIFQEIQTVASEEYVRLEYQSLTDKTLVIQNKAFVLKEGSIGLEVPLARVKQWEDIKPITTIQNVDSLLIGFFNMPRANTIDSGSILGASIFANAMDRFEELDRRHYELNWEFESGKRSLYVDENAFVKNKTTGELEIPNTRLYQTLRINPNSDKKMFEVFSPEFRNDNISSGINDILIAIEDSCGLARGTFSNMPDVTSRTATELRISKQRSFNEVKRIQKALERAITGYIEAVNTLLDLYQLGESGEYELAFAFGDSVLDSREQDFKERLQLVQTGILEKWELYAWYFNVKEETAKEKVAKEPSLFEWSE